jgi:hypothetical protein
VCMSVAVITWRLLSHCLAVGIFAELFPSNSCLCWLHNSGFQQTCHMCSSDFVFSYGMGSVAEDLGNICHITFFRPHSQSIFVLHF